MSIHVYTYACIHMYHVYAEGLGFADQGSGPDVHMHVCTHVHVCVCMYIGVFMQVLVTYVYQQVAYAVCIYMCKYVCTCTCAYACMFTCTCCHIRICLYMHTNSRSLLPLSRSLLPLHAHAVIFDICTHVRVQGLGHYVYTHVMYAYTCILHTCICTNLYLYSTHSYSRMACISIHVHV